MSDTETNIVTLDGVEKHFGAVRALDGVDFRAHCPHGRPLLVRLSVDDLGRRFGRS